MRPVTVATYFHDGEQQLISRQLEAISTWDEDVRNDIQYIAIHTGQEELKKSDFDHHDEFNWTLVQIHPYKVWNQSGGRNLAFHLAKHEWVAIMDADYIVPASSARKLVDLPVPPDDAYYIYTRNIIAKSSDLVNYTMLDKPEALSNSNKGNIFIMSKTMFWSVGGNDEDFAGKRGFEDTLFLHQLQARGYQQIVSDVVISHYMKCVPNEGIRKARNVRLFHSKSPNVPAANPLRFTWKELD